MRPMILILGIFFSAGTLGETPPIEVHKESEEFFSELPVEVRSSIIESRAGSRETRHEARQTLAQLLEKRREQMRREGYMTVPEHEVIGSRPKLLALAGLNESASSIPNLGFEPVNLSGSAIDDCVLQGAGGVPESDGRVHDVVRRFDCPQLGVVLLQEQSFSTNPSIIRFASSTPWGNLQINGEPGRRIREVCGLLRHRNEELSSADLPVL